MKTSILCSFVLAALLAACGPKTPTTTSSGDGASTGEPAEPEPADPVQPEPEPEPTAAAPARGEECGEADACAAGLECIKYYGIAGPKGPEFKSCETRCASDAECTDGTTCTTIADGPGQVCR